MVVYGAPWIALRSAGGEPFTWAMNAHVPAIVAEAFWQSRIVAFSTLCVYPFTDVTGPLLATSTDK